MRSWLNRIDIIFVCAFLLILAIVLFLLPNPTALDDTLRHLAMARMMTEQGIGIGWDRFLYWGTMSVTRVDPWFLFDVSLMPFAGFPDPVALDLAVFSSMALLCVCGWYAMHMIALSPIARTVCLWLLLFGDQQFFARMLIGRPFTVQTALAIAVIACVWNRQYFLTGVLIAISVLTSQLFVFPLFFALVGAVWVIAARGPRDATQLLTWIVIGAVGGFLLHPHALNYIYYLINGFIQIPLLADQVRLSREMRMPFEDISMMGVLIAIGAVLLCSMQALSSKGLRFCLRSMACYPVVLAMVLLPVYLLWVRAIDVLWPVLILSIAALTPMVQEHMRKHFRTIIAHRIMQGIGLTLIACQTIALPVWFFVFNDTRDLSLYSAVRSIPDGSRVLNVDWVHFPVYVLLQPHAQYATGIDPSFLYVTDPAVSQMFHALHYDNLSDEAISTSLLTLIAQSHATHLVMPTTWPERVKAIASSLPGLDEAARSAMVVVWRVSEY